MTDEYGGPLFVPEVDPDEKKLTTEKVARSLEEAGFPFSNASNYFRNLSRAGLVHPYSRQKTGKKAYYFKPDQIVIAAVLWRLSEAGLSGEELRRTVSRALNSWRLEDLGMTPEEYRSTERPPIPSSPALAALVAYLDGKRDFAFQVFTQRNRKTGETWQDARIGEGHVTLQKGEDWETRSVFTLDMDLVFAHLTRPREEAH